VWKQETQDPSHEKTKKNLSKKLHTSSRRAITFKTFMTIVKYAVTDNCNNTCNFSINAMIDTGSPISLIREDYAPYNIRRPIPLNMT